MTLGDMIQKMNDEGVEDVNAMIRALSGDNEELTDALAVSVALLDAEPAAKYRVIVGVLGFGVAIGYYRALQQCDALLGLAQSVRDKREGGLGPC